MNGIYFGLITSVFVLGAPFHSAAQEAASNAVTTRLATTTLSGYVGTSYRWTPGSKSGNDAYMFSGGEKHRDRFALDVVSLSLGSPMGAGKWATGYNVQMWLGPDADLLQTHDYLSEDPALALKEAYISIRVPVGSGLDLKAGVFDTIIGYESSDRILNPHHSHSWGKTIEPTQHTGFLVEYPVLDWLKLKGGVANTWSPKINAQAPNDNRFTLMGAATATLQEGAGFLEGSDITVGYVNGRPTGSKGDHVLVYQNFYFGSSFQTPIDGVNMGLAWDLLKQHGSGNDDNVLGVYLSYQASELLKFNVRGEMFESGAKLAAMTPAIDSDGWGVTGTADYRVWANTVARFEYRMDHTDQAVNSKTTNHAMIWSLMYEF